MPDGYWDKSCNSSDQAKLSTGQITHVKFVSTAELRRNILDTKGYRSILNSIKTALLLYDGLLKWLSSHDNR